MSPFLNVSVVLVFLLLAPGVHPQAAPPNPCSTKANGRYLCADCSTFAATSNRGPTFESNLLRFRDFVKDMSTGNTSFLNGTFAATGDAPEDTVYGLATCLSDAEATDCAACLAAAAGELPGTRCASRRDMVLWYPQCLVRYDNATFFGVTDTTKARWFDVPNPNNFSDPSGLAAARERLNGRMFVAAAVSPRRFAFDDEPVTGTANATLHGLAQCTEDLTAKECRRCLAGNVVRLGVCCADMDGVRINAATCYLRYEFMAIKPRTPPSMAPLVEPPPPEAPSGGAVSSSRTRRKTTIYIVAGALGSAALLCFLVAGGFWLWKKRRGSSPESRKRMESLLQLQHYPRRYSYAQVKRMTKSFADKLGQGGNGTVYKGRLPEPDGREVAVKMLKEAKVDGEEFLNEVASISRTSHVNVVTLLGFCLEGSKRGLVYEYMPNGSLDRYAVGDGGGRCCLRWEQLFDVALGIARGLEYLHRGCSAHIVHFDIKPHNILLDAGLRPKISDFGLAKLCPQKESTIAVSIAGARGTAGYIAPEVFSRHAGAAAAVTSKSDVYSYGMMVLEMAGATRGTGSGGVSSDDSGTGTASTAATRYFPEWLYQDLDRFCAEAAACGPDAEATKELVRKLVIVGLWCIRLLPQDRPTMSTVVEMLEKTTEADLQLPPGP